ncbi:DegT/DnrJ/EryC1/StrS family aminotransferase [Salimicrobium album]|uniref:dTDP-4-amino-4,6-dideoxygalactose transaminase n=1 Tax=Salimicrobium album TaxID=50717 RepID=A0A1H3EJP9_9BACI|nr:DegT/DnrJ/EryC1/StrS family aminotransferase [Salimicrobium album]SDX79002.1 dTDP-4-amino-4,6-dideoxygalactose transaminase [Salimicrobium album]
MSDFISITKPKLPKKEKYFEEISKVWENSWLTNQGPIHQDFERKIKEYLKVPYVSLFSHGHSALQIALKSLELTGEVITTPFTFSSTTNALIQDGLSPVFCDISINDYNIDVNKIEKLITNKTSAILAVHVFGTPCNVEEIARIANKYNLKVIYDAAHAFSVLNKGQSIAAYGDISMFSLHATKVFHAIEGGVLSYSNAIWKEKSEMLRNFGLDEHNDIEEPGINAKMSEFHAAMGVTNLSLIDNEIEKREHLTNQYLGNLNKVSGISTLKYEREDVNYNFAYFPILVEKEIFGINRDDLQKYLYKNNIGTKKYFHPLTSNFEAFKAYRTKAPVAEYVANNVLCLPLYSDLTEEEVEFICEKIISVNKEEEN